MAGLVPIELIESKIFSIRGKRVMLDKDLAELYGVPTKRLNEQVKRNVKRFPGDFMLKLSWEEIKSLRSHFATLKRGQHIKYRMYAFTEQGIAMLSSVLNSEIAIQVNIAIIRVFVRLREILSTHKELAHKLAELEGKIERHDEEIRTIFEAIRHLMTQPKTQPETPPETLLPKPQRKIGFHAE